jgi:four helix bundle protein
MFRKLDQDGGMGRFQDLKVWRRGKDLAVWVYQTTGQGEFCRDFGLRDQIRRAVVSIPSNIAEGDELNTNAQAIRHFYIAKGSTAEVLTQGIIAREIGYLSPAQYEHIEQECTALSGMLNRLIQARQSSLTP